MDSLFAGTTRLSSMLTQGSMQGIIKNLSELKLYNLSEQSLISKELAAYEKGFDTVNEMFLRLCENCFIQTCSEQRLREWEQLLNVPSSSKISIADRRSIVLYKLAVAPNDFYKKGMEQSIKSTGVDAEIIENPPLGIIKIIFNFVFGQYENLDSVKRQVKAILPAHLNAEFDIGSLTWKDFDDKNYTFRILHAKDFTWEWFDINGINL